MYVVASKIFDSESNSTKLDGIKLLDFVIIFSLLIFEWSSNKPKSIDWFFFLIFGSDSMVKIVALYIIKKKRVNNLMKFKSLLTIILFELAKAPSIWMLFCVYHVIRLSKINLIIVSNDLTLRLSFQTHLHNISWFVVEKTVWVSQPGYCSEEYSIRQEKSIVSILC